MLQLREWIELAAQGVEVLAVAIMVSFIIYGTVRWLFHSVNKIVGSYERYHVMLGKTLLIGLELLVAADIIRTIAIDMTPINLALLGGLVLVRTFLGWAVTVEIEGHWPWQKTKKSHPSAGEEVTLGE